MELVGGVVALLAVGLVGGVVALLAVGLVGGVVALLAVGLVGGVVALLVVGLLAVGGLVLYSTCSDNIDIITVYDEPNQILYWAAWNTLAMGLSGGLVFGLGIGLCSGLIGWLAIGLVFGPGAGLVGGLVFGWLGGLVFGWIAVLDGRAGRGWRRSVSPAPRPSFLARLRQFHAIELHQVSGLCHRPDSSSPGRRWLCLHSPDVVGALRRTDEGGPHRG